MLERLGIVDCQDIDQQFDTARECFVKQIALRDHDAMVINAILDRLAEIV